MWFIQFFLGLAACAVASVWSYGQADVITDWNQVTLDVIRADQTPPPPATRTLAMVHLAMYEAVNGINGQYEPYLLPRPAPSGASPEAAAATAAHRVLVAQYPDLKKELDAVLAESLAAITDKFARRKGNAWGRFCGNQVLQWRRHDGADTTIFYEPSGQFGYWQPTPPNFAPALLPQWPYVAPFAIRNPRQFPVPPPPSFASPDYAVAFHEVKAYGAIDSAVRTADQTLIAYFWEDGPGTVTPPGHWQVIGLCCVNFLLAQHGHPVQVFRKLRHRTVLQRTDFARRQRSFDLS